MIVFENLSGLGGGPDVSFDPEVVVGGSSLLQRDVVFEPVTVVGSRPRAAAASSLTGNAIAIAVGVGIVGYLIWRRS